MSTHTCNRCRMPTRGYCDESGIHWMHCEECHFEIQADERAKNAQDDIDWDVATDVPCDYCGNTPSWRVEWSSGNQTRVLHLCAICDAGEIDELY